jgi:signal peptidase I
MKRGDRISTSNLITPKRFNFICYHQTASEFWEGGTWLMRVCGLPGDKIQIIDGILYVNDQNADTFLNLKNEYIFKQQELNKIPEGYFKNHEDDLDTSNPDSVHGRIETSVFNSKGLVGILAIRKDADHEIQKIYNQPWTVDNFGPIFVPTFHYFVLGDNRHAAADSRYTGFINQNDYIGTVWLIK